MKHCPSCLRNWNVDGNQKCPYCDCALAAGSSGSPPHTRFEITTRQGNRATIKGNPNMPEATRNALAEMIDAAVTAANTGELKTTP